MSFPPNTPDEARSSTAGFFAKLVIFILVVTAAFVVPYVVVKQNEAKGSTSTVSPEAVHGGTATPHPAVNDPGTVKTSAGTLPDELTFVAGDSLPSSATLALASPSEAGWDLISQTNGVNTYKYRALGCTITSQIVSMKFTATGEGASTELLTNELKQTVSSSDVTVANLEYNFQPFDTQFVGVGTSDGGLFKWNYGRAFPTMNKGVYITASCGTKDTMFQAADELRAQFGVLIKA
jgi:hypothetical protein